MGVKVSEIKTENGTLISGNNKMTYAEIAKENKKWEIPKTPELRPKSAFKVVGKSVKRTDLKAKVMGTAKYTLDSELPRYALCGIATIALFGWNNQNT